MQEEVARLSGALQETEELSEGGFTLFRGRLEDKPVLVAQCGIGKVNAAALTQVMVLKGVWGVLFTGVAGAVDPSLKVGDIVVSTDALQHDLDVTALGYALGQVPGEPLSWAADDTLRELALEAAGRLEGVRAVAGRVVSGDRFIASQGEVARLRELFGAACTEMEGAATAQVCHRAGVPFVIVRSMSDTADGAAEVDFRAFTPLAAARAERVVRETVRRL